jgi:hypothetical protein
MSSIESTVSHAPPQCMSIINTDAGGGQKKNRLKRRRVLLSNRVYKWWYVDHIKGPLKPNQRQDSAVSKRSSSIFFTPK